MNSLQDSNHTGRGDTIPSAVDGFAAEMHHAGEDVRADLGIKPKKLDLLFRRRGRQ